MENEILKKGKCIIVNENEYKDLKIKAFCYQDVADELDRIRDAYKKALDELEILRKQNPHIEITFWAQLKDPRTSGYDPDKHRSMVGSMYWCDINEDQISLNIKLRDMLSKVAKDAYE